MTDDDDIVQRWPVRDVLLKLADAGDHLLSDHDCDRDGWEEISFAVRAARIHALRMTGDP